ncbi:MAG TPA: hypothetical protein VHE53_03265 [Patescibacteria group bacterium]|nr:hypothetical protein [Patescibacteria group bacterium]
MPKKQNKKKSSVAWILASIVLVFGVVFFVFTHRNPRVAMAPTRNEAVINSLFENYNVKLDGESLDFKNGMYKGSSGDHSAVINYQVTNPTGNKSVAILIDSPGGSGTFYYLVASANNNGSITYSSPIPLGDRIKIESLSIDSNDLVKLVYFDRSAGEPMAATPTQEVSANYSFQDDGSLTPAH